MRTSRQANLLFLLAILAFFTSCQTGNRPLTPGMWRGSFTLPGNEVPFVFEVKGNIPENTSVYLHNGEDRFELKKISYDADSLTIPIDLYDAALRGKVKENSFEGRFIKTAGGKTITSIPFTAKPGNLPRFAVSGQSPAVSLHGTWDILIGSPGNAEKTVGNFTQKGALLSGSILTTTGDYRFLEGVVQGKKFALSAFGGSTIYLVKGEFLTDSTFTGEFINPRKTSEIEGKRNPKAALADPYLASQLKPGFSTVTFTFPNLEGKAVSLSDPVYKGKVVIVTVLGSWCPNCLDENSFLSDWYKQNHQRGVEIIGLGFERQDDFSTAKKSLSNLKARLDIGYEILFAGKSGNESASRALPALTAISGFPTTLFIDKKGNVRKVHTGFNGPATGKFYEEFKTEFNGLIDQLLAEK